MNIGGDCSLCGASFVAPGGSRSQSLQPTQYDHASTITHIFEGFAIGRYGMSESP